MEALNRMMADFESATGKHDVILLSGYRSPEQQQALLDQETAASGAESAKKTVAPVGGSEHHTGLALDLGIYTDSGRSVKFRPKGDYAWLAKNMYRYGFVVRYREEKSGITGITGEPWHIRYVGVPHAGVMEQLNYCLEEYLNYLQGFTPQGKHLFIRGEGRVYEIYSQKVFGSAQLPSGKPFTASKDNQGNCIVTIELPLNTQ